MFLLCHIMYTCTESILYNNLISKNPLLETGFIWNLSDYNGTQTHDHLVWQRLLNHLPKLTGLAKWMSVCLRTKWLLVWPTLQTYEYFKKIKCGRKRSYYTYTPWNLEGHGNAVYLDRHYVRCAYGYGLSKFHLVHNGRGYYRYSVRCTKIVG